MNQRTSKVYACIDGLANTHAVIDWAAWAAMRLRAPLEFLHVLERHPERSEGGDYSGTIGIDARESLLQELSEADEKRGRQAQEDGRRLLAAARERVAETVARELERDPECEDKREGEHEGPGPLAALQLDARLRHGDFVETVQEMQADARLFVLGEHAHARTAAATHLDHHVEQVVRSVQRSVLVATAQAFQAPQRLVLAFDGSANARKTVDHVADSALLAGLPLLLVTVGLETPLAQRQLQEACITLQQAGFEVETRIVAGEPRTVLPALVKEQAPALLLMGGFGHSRLRQLLLGSTTTALLRLSDVPVLFLR